MASKEQLLSISNTRAIALLLHYFLGYLFVYRIIATQITLLIEPQAMMLLPVTQWGIYLFTTLVSIFLAWPILKASWARVKENPKHYLMLSIRLTGLILILNIAASIVVSFITQTDNSANQIGIESATKIQPLITVISASFFAPMIEECVFRAGAFSALRKYMRFSVAAVLSGLLFGSIHIVDSLATGNFVDVSYLIVYGVMGVVLALGYEKSNTIAVPIGIHVFNNLISFFIMFT